MNYNLGYVVFSIERCPYNTICCSLFFFFLVSAQNFYCTNTHLSGRVFCFPDKKRNGFCALGAVCAGEEARIHRYISNNDEKMCDVRFKQKTHLPGGDTYGGLPEGCGPSYAYFDLQAIVSLRVSLVSHRSFDFKVKAQKQKKSRPQVTVAHSIYAFYDEISVPILFLCTLGYRGGGVLSCAALLKRNPEHNQTFAAAMRRSLRLSSLHEEKNDDVVK